MHENPKTVSYGIEENHQTDGGQVISAPVKNGNKQLPLSLWRKVSIQG